MFEAVEDDAGLFGSGDIASRPASGTADGDFYNVLDQAGQIFRIDRWSSTNAAWMVGLHKTTSDPGASDDQASGYFIGTIWINTSTPEAFVCTDATPSLAVWISITSSSGAPDATESVKGILELANQAETDAGTDDLRAVTPLKLKARALSGGQLGGTVGTPDVRGLRETGGATLLTYGAIADTEILTRVGTTVAGSTLTEAGIAGFDYAFTSKDGPFIATNNGSYEVKAAFRFRGTDTVGNINVIKAVANVTGASTGSVRLFDFTNGLQICEKTGIADTIPTIQDLGTVSNLPTGDAIIEVQMLVGSGKIQVASVVGEVT